MTKKGIRNRTLANHRREHKLGVFSFLIIFSVVQAYSIPPTYGFVLPHTSSSVSTSQSTTDVGLPQNSPRRDDEIIYFDSGLNILAVFSTLGTAVVPMLLGKIEEVNGEPIFIPTLRIQAAGELYILTQPDEPNFLKVIERLPEGGMGRLLRYRALDQMFGWTDLEFVYDDRENLITILDHAAGRFYRTIFKQKPAEPITLFPLTRQQHLIEEFRATTNSNQKFLRQPSISTHLDLPEMQTLHLGQTYHNESNVWRNRLVRGPPVGALPS